ncbi:MAG: TonB-dependent receptor [Luteimonas sp.]
MTIDRKYLLAAMAYAILGMLLGIYMAISQNHAEHPAHAHILLVGFVVSMIYAIIYKLWLPTQSSSKLALLQFVVHQLGAAIFAIGLFLLFRGTSQAALAPVLGSGSLFVLAAALMMLVQIVKSCLQTAPTPQA